MIILMRLSGFLFLLIMVLQLVMAAFGYRIEMGDFDADIELQKINNNPKKFQIAIVLALVEHASIIVLTIMLFIVYGPYNIILGIIWTIFRIGEGLIQFYNEKKYWGLHSMAKHYSVTSGAEKESLNDKVRIILQTKDHRFKFAMVCWSIGTLAYSIVFVTYLAILPIFIIGWIGLAASIFVGFGDGIQLVRPNIKIFKILETVGGLSAIVFEVVLGIYLLFFV